MSYNKTLQSNNTDLQAILNTINALPETSATQVTPEISVDASGLITATAGSKSATYQLAFQAAKTITPSSVNQIAVSSGYYTGGDITVAGDENLMAENIKSGVSVFGVSGTLEDKDSILKGLINRTITEIRDDEVEAIGDYAFCNCELLSQASFASCKSIGAFAFSRCLLLTSMKASLCETIGHNAFDLCKNLSSVAFPACKSIGAYAFERCGLLDISFSRCLQIDTKAFYLCQSLKTVNLPSCTYVGNGAFSDCNSLATINLPLCSYIGVSAFVDCKKLASINLPYCGQINQSAFYDCSKLSTVILGDYCFCSLNDSKAFMGTPFNQDSFYSSVPIIYVPSSRLSIYQANSVWSYYTEYLRPLGQDTFTFSINGIEYQSEMNMTWAMWVESEYNTDQYYVAGESIDKDSGMYRVVYNGSAVNYLRPVVPGRAYSAVGSDEPQ